jgi:predicted ArsR family transcriptional regulator
MPVSSGSDDRALSSGRRAQLLDLLQATEDPLSVAELAVQVGLHGNTVRSHLEILVRSGMSNGTPIHAADRGVLARSTARPARHRSRPATGSSLSS